MVPFFGGDMFIFRGGRSFCQVSVVNFGCESLQDCWLTQKKSHPGGFHWDLKGGSTPKIAKLWTLEFFKNKPPYHPVSFFDAPSRINPQNKKNGPPYAVSVASVASVAEFPASSNVDFLGCNADNGASSSIALTSSCKSKAPPPAKCQPLPGILHHNPLIGFYKGLIPWEGEDTCRFPIRKDEKLPRKHSTVAPRRTSVSRSSRFPLDKGVGKIAQQNPVLDALISWMKHEFICLSRKCCLNKNTAKS